MQSQSEEQIVEALQTGAHPYEAGSTNTTEAELHEEHIHLPPPTIWPMTMALGVTTVGLGPLTWAPVSILGLIIMFFALVNWIQELRHESH